MLVFHVLIHVVRSIKNLGPLIETNMFSFERFIGFLVRNVGNYSASVQNIAMNYTRLSGIFLHNDFFTKLVLQGFKLGSKHLLGNDPENSTYHTKLQLSGRKRELQLTFIQAKQFQKYILLRSSTFEDHYQQYLVNDSNQSFTEYCSLYLNSTSYSQDQINETLQPFGFGFQFTDSYYLAYRYTSILTHRNINALNNDWVYDITKKRIGQIRFIAKLFHANSLLQRLH